MQRNLENTENTFTTQHTHVDERQLHVLHIKLNYKHNGFPNYDTGDLPTISLNMMLQ